MPDVASLSRVSDESGDDAVYMDASQQRLEFPEPTDPVRFAFALAGLRVLVDVVSGPLSAASAYLAARGVAVSQDEHMSFPVRHLALLGDLPAHVHVDVDHLLRSMWLLVQHRPDAPAVVERVAGELRLAWSSLSVRFDESLAPEAVPALLASDIAFVASPPAWQDMTKLSSLPVTLATARWHARGYIELAASKPHAVEVAPIPGLFRIDETTFGVPAAYAEELTHVAGIVADPPVRPPKRPKVTVSRAGLSQNASHTARELANRVAMYRGALLVAPEGGSRRVACMAALHESGFRSPVVIAAPWALWSWHRAHQLANATLTPSTLTVVPYGDVPSRPLGVQPDAFVFDDLAEVPAPSRRTLRQFDALDVARVVVADAWPTEIPRQLELASYAFPYEFRPDVPLVLRYPHHPEVRAFEHLRPYLIRTGKTPGHVSRLSVDRLALPDELREASATCAAIADAAERRRALAEIATCGVESLLSPKVASVLETITSRPASDRIVVLTRHRRLATLLAAALRPRRVVIAEDDFPSEVTARRAAVTFAVFDTAPPKVANAQLIVVADWPWSFADLDAAVPAATATNLPSLRICHVVGSIDDRIASFAARHATSEATWESLL